MNSSRLRHLLTMLLVTSTISDAEYRKSMKCYRKYSAGIPLTNREHAVLTFVWDMGNAMFPVAK